MCSLRPYILCLSVKLAVSYIALTCEDRSRTRRKKDETTPTLIVTCFISASWIFVGIIVVPDSVYNTAHCAAKRLHEVRRLPPHQPDIASYGPVIPLIAHRLNDSSVQK